MITYKITNEELFDEKVIDVDTDSLKMVGGYMDGTIDIEIEPSDKNGCGEHVQITGQHGFYDYEDFYGFELIEE